jgi:hypothetical protein
MSVDRSSARGKTNRNNARLSTGPKTARGKKRASKNALRQGLSIPIDAIPHLRAEVEDLALPLVAGDPNDVRLEVAREIAAAHIDIMRIREARKVILEDQYRRLPKMTSRQELRITMRIAARKPLTPECRAYLASRVGLLPSGMVPNLASNLHRVAKELERCDRYEKRALSRRRTAIRMFDLMGLGIYS